jgi:hypothetical protein
MGRENNQVLQWAYWAVLAAVGLWVLAAFLTPTARHSGLNLYDEIRFPKMVQGTAYRPFVARTLLPSTVRALTAATPVAWREGLDRITERNPRLNGIFDTLGWEYKGSVQYYYAALLMWISFVGFAHFTVALTCRQLEWSAGAVWRTALGAAALLGLPALFKYSSFPYDPPQLFLFTLALYLMATGRTRAFLVVFLLCCLNKETAALLIPINAFYRRGKATAQEIRRELVFLIAGYVVIKGGLIWVFRDNPGSFVEFHLVDHNLPWLVNGWSATEVIVILVLATLVFVRWREKPSFLRIALLGILPVQVGLALFIGFIDEWRIYYEVYPIVFGLTVATLRLFVGAGRFPSSRDETAC